jgi:hypothetical protein
VNYIDQIASLEACPDAVQWLREANYPIPEAAWIACPRADWMFWLLQKSSQPKIKALILCACDIAETALIHIPADENRPRIAIETARRWLAGEASEDEMRAAMESAALYVAILFTAALDAVSIAESGLTTALAVNTLRATHAAAVAAEYVICAARNPGDVGYYVLRTTEFAAASSTYVALGNNNKTASAFATSAVMFSVTHANAAAHIAQADIVRRHFPAPPEIK